MKKSLHKEIIFLANKISKLKINSSQDKYYNLVIELYEKIILFKNTDQYNKNIVLDEQLVKNNLNLINDNIMTNTEAEKETTAPLIETIKEMIPEMPESNINSFFLNNDSANLAFEKKPPNDTDNVLPKIHDQFAKIFKIDVNDRSSFIQKLFDEKIHEYENTMKKISTFQNWKLINEFIEKDVKPKYNNWKNNLHIEKRFLDVLKKQLN